MSEPIVWERGRWGAFESTVDGVPVRSRVNDAAPDEVAVRARTRGFGLCITVIDGDKQSVDLAARAVVAAVRVLRCETDAAVAAERERCAELHGLLLQVAPWIGGVPFHPDTIADVAAAKRRIIEIIEGAPAPREG